ncbi:MAG: hypothetical protein ABSG53_09060 [Thermoguttaceae bacterium]|jgi:hypothetical protein
MLTPAQSRRSLFTPDRLVLSLLVAEALLWLSNWPDWPAWHKGYAVLTCGAIVGLGMILMLGWFLVAVVFRRRFQFGIRSLLVMAVAVAITSSWFGAEMRQAKEQRKKVETFNRLTGDANYDWQVDRHGNRLPNAQPSQPAWLRDLLGDDFFAEVVSVHATYRGDAEVVQLKAWKHLRILSLTKTDLTDTGLACIAGLSQLQNLCFSSKRVTDAGLAHIPRLTKLETLCFANTEVTDGGLAHIARLNRLQTLFFSGPNVTDAGLANIAGLTQLHDLSVYDAKVTDAGLAHIARLPKLQILWLYNTQVTDVGVAKLQKSLPNCEIHWQPPRPPVVGGSGTMPTDQSSNSQPAGNPLTQQLP